MIFVAGTEAGKCSCEVTVENQAYPFYRIFLVLILK